MSWRGIVLALLILVIGLIVLRLVGDVLVDWAWFSSLAYLDVYWTMLAAKIVLFLVTFLVSGGFVWVNGALALRFALPQGHPAGFVWQPVSDPALANLLTQMHRHVPWHHLVFGTAAIVALLIAAMDTKHWDLVLRFIFGVELGQSDPVYGKDIGFYLFSLPAYLALKDWMLLMLLSGAVLAGLVYWAHGDIEFRGGRRWMSPAAIAHGSALLGCFFAVKAASYVLDRFLLLYGDNGVVVGAGYTDIHVQLPVLWLLIVLAITAALACWVNLGPRTYRLPAAAAALLFGSAFVLAGVVPAVFQRLFVKPTELELEKPYIQRNIAHTRRAYNLDGVAVRPFPVEQSLTLETLAANRATIDNIRLWDWQPLMDTNSQMQEIRTYYRFHDVDIDRYWLDGTYQAVMLSARELKSALLPANAQTWVNRHLLFTHGNGVVMSPVTRMSGEGLPVFYLQDIPPVATRGPKVEEPRIYFGEETDGYVVVKGSASEFDYPAGKENVYRSYDGRDGVALGSVARRLLFAWYFEDLSLLFSGYITAESRIMFHRTIAERIRTLAPFLRLDHDPYVVVSAGRLFWIQDAYTTSRYFPYAEPAPGGELNYIRNAVKIVVDAYHGTVDFYLADAADPIAATYRRIFPGLFKPLQSMPGDLQKHIRYPEDLFRLQAQLYRAYHMESPDVFYNREDLWQFPRQAGGGQAVPMVPYYIIMRLPGEDEAEFFLMLPMVPSRRDNMIAWLAARCDPANYGKLIVYEFPKEKLVFGPFQIEARINQNTEISQQLSLWNQMGSRVIRGHLIVIPIENSILYVSPLYLRAEAGQLPELKRVIAAYGDRVVMEETLADALAALFKETRVPSPLPGGLIPASPPANQSDRGQRALDHYNRAMERLKSGDWTGFGAELNKLQSLLEELGRP
jgi:uncharacterized membrane protein (UPF0182 family)